MGWLDKPITPAGNIARATKNSATKIPRCLIRAAPSSRFGRLPSRSRNYSDRASLSSQPSCARRTDPCPLFKLCNTSRRIERLQAIYRDRRTFVRARPNGHGRPLRSPGTGGPARQSGPAGDGGSRQEGLVHGLPPVPLPPPG